MKQAVVLLTIIVLACCMGVPKGGTETAPQAPAAAQAQAAPVLAGDTFTGTIVTGHMKGSMMSPRLLADISGADGLTVSFMLRKSTAVTEVDGKSISFMKGFKKGRRVEIKFVVKDGQNEAVAMHYLS
ncbi:MAG: hypothetical protein ABFD80_07040 [Acidobacteriota bacterium]